MKKILISGVVRQNPAVFDAHIACLKALEVPDGYEVEFLHIDDSESVGTVSFPGTVWDTKVPRPNNAQYVVNETTHGWNEETFQWLAYQKQRILDHARDNYDAVFLLDSDLLVAPDTLTSLVTVDVPIVSAVFWTRWLPESSPMPQVWLSHPYKMQGGNDPQFYDREPVIAQYKFLRTLGKRDLCLVRGLGACTLIRSDVLDRVRYYPRLEGLPNEGMWQGEDRSFSIRASDNHIPLYADAFPDIWHCYRPSDRADLDYWVKELADRTLSRASLGDLVSFIVSPMNEKDMSNYRLHMRGRLGELCMAPEIEHALLDMEKGDDRLIEIHFPPWHGDSRYRDQKYQINLRFVAARRYSKQPGL